MTQYSLTDLTQQLRRVIALNFAELIWLKCELSQVNSSRGQHYLHLIQKDSDNGEIIAAANAILWLNTHRKLQRKLGRSLEAILQNGMEVLLQVRVEYSERWGLSLHVEDIDPAYTLGQLEIQRQQTITVLEKKGLLGLNRQVDLPPVVQRIAIISSLNAAGYQDFMHQLEQNEYGYQFDIQLFTAAMQGALVEKEILQQLKRVRRHPRPFSAVVIIRGGGAKLDLAAFDSLKLATAVAQFPLPVLTGIGHDVDEVVLDLVAYKALKTPTAVADYLIQYHLRFETRLLNIGMNIQQKAQEQIREQDHYLQRMRETVWLQSQIPLQRANYQLGQIEVQLPHLVNFKIKQEKQTLENIAKMVDLLSPEATLQRGFAIIRQEGEYLSTINKMDKNKAVEIEMKDGKIDANLLGR